MRDKYEVAAGVIVLNVGSKFFPNEGIVDPLISKHEQELEAMLNDPTSPFDYSQITGAWLRSFLATAPDTFPDAVTNKSKAEAPKDASAN